MKNKGRVGFSVILILTAVLLVSCGVKKYGYLGIRIPIGKGTVTEKTPYIIHEVMSDSPFYEKLEPGDIIVQIDSVPLKGKTYNYIYENLIKREVGSRITLRIKRKEKEHIFQFQLNKSKSKE